MDQDIRFGELDGRRIAYATVGDGPLLVFGAKWVSHLEEEWDDPRARSFYEDLARTHRVVRYDRLGVGLSDRGLPAPPTVANETRVL
jgi:pimeloyl-ACP methyl ester carboxylesterase